MINLTKLQDLVFWQPELRLLEQKLKLYIESKVEIKKAEPPVSKKIEKEEKEKENR